MFLFYAPLVENGECCLSPAESHHCAKVLRLVPGQEVWVTDGEGSLYAAELSVVSDKACLARVRGVLRGPGDEDNPRPCTHIVMAPTKNMDRTEWFLEKATEVGLGRITFVCTEHSERKVVKDERVRGILLAAMKQSQQAWLPLSDPMMPFKAYVQERERLLREGPDTYPQKFIAYCGREYPKKDFLSVLEPDRGVEVIIGPEGDFSPAEVEFCVRNGYTPVSLASTRLRTETAALLAAWGAVLKKHALR